MIGSIVTTVQCLMNFCNTLFATLKTAVWIADNVRGTLNRRESACKVAVCRLNTESARHASCCLSLFPYDLS